LVNYSDSLKTEALFKDVNVPVSSFAKDADIPFSLSINAKINLTNEK
jgi:hypothetical protein